MRPQRIKLRVGLAGAVLLLLGGGLFCWKVFVVDLPLLPSQPKGLWQVELAIAARTRQPEVTVRAALPEPGPSQLVFGEQFSSGRLRLSLRDDPERGRLAVWRGNENGAFRLGAGFRVQVNRKRDEMPVGRTAPPPDEVVEAWGGAAVGYPAEDDEVLEAVRRMEDVAEGDVGGWVRSIYAFVRHEIRQGSGDDPVRILRTGEGSRAGRERLLATLLRAAGVPARLMRGLELEESNTRERVWCEAWVDGRWWPLSVSSRFFANLPDDFVRFGASGAPMVEGTGVDSLEYGYRALPERLTAQELAALLTPDTGLLAWLSLYRLPAGTQSALRILLLLPVAALVLTLLRNVIGMPSFGTFMPMLIALALRGTGLSIGLFLVGLVLSIGVLGRLFITRLRLLLVPRLSVLLSLVILTIALLSLLGLEFDNRDFFAGILFPIVILTMLVERFSITLEEEGWLSALQKSFWSVLIAIVVYPVFRSPALEQILFSYPELVLVVMGLCVWLGAYTGYRVSDLVRFRSSAFEAAS